LTVGHRLKLDLAAPATAPLAKGASLALGNFDGVHRGHQAVIAAAVEHAHAHGQPAGAVVFEPHPRQLFQPKAEPFRLQSGAQRARALRSLGAETVIEIRFDRAFSSLSPEAFAKDILAVRIGAAHICIGMDFRYGQGRRGDAQTLQAQGAAFGFAVTVVDAVDDSDHPGDKISSSAVREALQAGDPALAERLLGRPFAIEGPVIHGQARGRTINFPTANLALGAYLRPQLGVYAVRAKLEDGEVLPGVANLGVRPTVAGADAEPLLETHLFDFEGDLYAQTIEVALIAFLRAERKFESFEALTRQIAEDAAAARALLTAAP
jgi:riboflavin kinase / FMN adenylyltransferase